MQTSAQTGNLSPTERTWSAVAGTALSLFVFRSGGPVLRSMAALAGAGLLARAFAGHCGVKAALSGQTSLGQGLRDQLTRLSGSQSTWTDAQESVEEHTDPVEIYDGSAESSSSLSRSGTRA